MSKEIDEAIEELKSFPIEAEGMIDEVVYFRNGGLCLLGIIKDKVNVLLASGTNEYVAGTQYVICQIPDVLKIETKEEFKKAHETDFGHIHCVYPYMLVRIVPADVFESKMEKLTDDENE